MTKVFLSGILLLSSTTLGGCALGVAAGAGAVAADEANENDGEFDPLEKSYDGDDSTSPLDRD